MKKGITILLMLSLMLSLMAPFAVSANELPGQGTSTGTGTVISYQSHGDILGGVLPTGNNLNFVIDPEGLLALTAGDSVADAEGSNAVVFGGSKTDGDVLEAFSTSSVATVLTVALSLTTAGSTAVATAAAVSADDEANVLMWAEPGADVVNTDGDTFEGSGEAIAYGATAGDTTVKFLLDAVEYEIKTTGAANASTGIIPTEQVRKADTPNKNGVALKFGGIININDTDVWSEVGNMSVQAVFTMTKATVAEIAAKSTVATAPYGWMANHADYVAPTTIAVPAGGGAVRTVTPDAQGWSLIATIPTAVQGVNINGEWTSSPNEFFYAAETGALFINVAPGRYNVIVVGMPPNSTIIATIDVNVVAAP